MATLALLVATSLSGAPAAPAQASAPEDNQEESTTQDADSSPTPTDISVSEVPIVVTSTTSDYFVLYVSHDVDGNEVEYPVQVKLGEEGTTTLSENVSALPADRYRVEKYLVAGSCIRSRSPCSGRASRRGR